ncbi:MAG TPA: hypothetical protein VF377_06900 [Acidimicrobiia bacterium]
MKLFDLNLMGTTLFDDFISNDVVTDNGIGQLGWQFTTIGNASTLAYQTAHSNGVLRITTAATADGDGTALHLFPDGIVLKPGFAVAARIRYPVELASMNFRVGLDDSVTATRPTVGVTVESDAGVLSCHTDSADHGDESVAVADIGSLTSGNTAVVAQWLDVLMIGSGRANAQGGPDAVDFFIDGVHAATVPCHIDDDEEVEPKFAVWQDSGGADAVAIEIDYFGLFLPRN